MLIDTKKEALVFARYLGARNILPSLESRYEQAIHLLELQPANRESQLLSRIIKSPFLLPFIDGGLALIQPHNIIRKRLLVMCALMETEHLYAHLFLTESNQSFALPRFLYRGTVAMMKGLIGACLIKCLRWS